MEPMGIGSQNIRTIKQDIQDTGAAIPRYLQASKLQRMQAFGTLSPQPSRTASDGAR